MNWIKAIVIAIAIVIGLIIATFVGIIIVPFAAFAFLVFVIKVATYEEEI